MSDEEKTLEEKRKIQRETKRVQAARDLADGLKTFHKSRLSVNVFNKLTEYYELIKEEKPKRREVESRI